MTNIQILFPYLLQKQPSLYLSAIRDCPYLIPNGSLFFLAFRFERSNLPNQFRLQRIQFLRRSRRAESLIEGEFHLGDLCFIRFFDPGDLRFLRGREFFRRAGGLFEALFLVVITRTAFAITDGSDLVGLIAGWEVGVNTAVFVSLAFVLTRVGLAIISTSQSAKLSSTVIAGVRRDLAQAFMQASFPSQP